MNAFRELDTVVLTHDVPWDLGAVVYLHSVDVVAVEFVTAAGRTQALVTLGTADVRAVRDDDLLAVRVAAHKGAA